MLQVMMAHIESQTYPIGGDEWDPSSSAVGSAAGQRQDLARA